jgi:hypothetical protein
MESFASVLECIFLSASRNPRLANGNLASKSGPRGNSPFGTPGLQTGYDHYLQKYGE